MSAEPRDLKRMVGLEQVLGVEGAARLEAALQAAIEWCHGIGPLCQPGTPDGWVPFAGTAESRAAILAMRESVRNGIVTEPEFRAMVCFVRALEESAEVVKPGEEDDRPKIVGPRGEEVH